MITVGNYLAVELTSFQKSKTIKIHTLVLLAYVGPRPEGFVCRHLDGNPRNNHISNLKWGTYKENAADRTLHDRRAFGEDCSTSVLKEFQIIEIFELFTKGETIKSIARKMKNKPSSVKAILNRTTWKCVKIDPQVEKIVSERLETMLESYNKSLLSDHEKRDILNDIFSKNLVDAPTLMKKYNICYGALVRLLNSSINEALRKEFPCDFSQIKHKKRVELAREDILEIFRMYRSGQGLLKIGKKYNFDKKTIKKIILRQSFLDVDVPENLVRECERIFRMNKSLSVSFKKKGISPDFFNEKKTT